MARTTNLDRLRTAQAYEWPIHASRIILLALTVGFGLATVTGQMPSVQTQMVIYLVGMVGLNLPHGGYEHFSNLRHRGLPFGTRYVAVYIGAVVGFIALFFIVPLLALALAFATAVAKGGHGDLRVMDAVVGSGHLTSRVQRGLAAFVRGGAVMIVPLVFFPETFYGFASFMVSIFDPTVTGVLWERMEVGRIVLGGLYAVALGAHIALGYAADGLSSSWLADLGETSLLVSYFAVVPVIVSIGLYFPLWYTMRQAGRSVYVKEHTPEDNGLPVILAWAAMAVGALATALVAAALWVIAPNPLGTVSLLPGLVAFYTIFVCIIALPHVVVGDWLDMKRGIWYVP